MSNCRSCLLDAYRRASAQCLLGAKVRRVTSEAPGLLLSWRGRLNPKLNPKPQGRGQRLCVLRDVTTGITHPEECALLMCSLVYPPTSLSVTTQIAEREVRVRDGDQAGLPACDLHSPGRTLPSPGQIPTASSQPKPHPHRWELGTPSPRITPCHWVL